MLPKRRILVVHHRKGNDPVKLVVPINQDATIEALVREIAGRVGEEVKLEIGDGFELHPQDGIDIILDSDVVVAKSCQEGSSKDPHVETPESQVLDSSILINNRSKEQHQERDGFQIRLVTAELAHNHAKETLKETSEPSDGVLAFNGEFVSGNTTMSALRQEAAEVFGWALPGKSLEDTPCCHLKRTTCSCAVAHEVELYELSSTLHCRFTIDGTKCNHEDCPFSHVSIPFDDKWGLLAPHCSICDDALSFPCPSCLQKAETDGIEPNAVVCCAIVKNAGCGHVHHAHCLGPKKDASMACPSGCPRSTVHREAIPFGQETPSVTVIWDGDKIENVPIPPRFVGIAGQMLYLSTEFVINLVGEYLRAKSVDLSELSLRIHARDPQTETVRFVWSTLVSICSEGIHYNVGYRRFPFPAAESSSSSFISTEENASSYEIDFHTSSLPIIVCGCSRLKDAFLRDGNPGGNMSLTLYVVKRSHEAVAPVSNLPVSKQSSFRSDAAWQPSVHQTQRGMAALLSSLLVLSQMVRKKGIESENKLLATLYSFTRFPPAVRALGLLLLNVTIRPQEKAALSEALFHSLKDFVSTAASAFVHNQNRRFETVRILLGHFLSISDGVQSAVARPLEAFSLVCAISYKRLVHPVLLEPFGVVERSSGELYSTGGPLSRTINEFHEQALVGESGMQLHQVLAQTREYNGTEVQLLCLHKIGKLVCPIDLGSAGRNFSDVIRQANETDLISRGPLELKNTSVVPPQVVLDNEGFLAVFTGRGCGTTRDVNFYRPTAGGDTGVDVNDVEYTLQKVIPERKAEDTWDVDCFGSIPAKARAPDEAIVLCLDLSSSMNDGSAVEIGDVPFNDVAEGEKSVDDVVKDHAEDFILQKAEEWISDQHESCHEAWKFLVEREITIERLIEHLSLIAQREVLTSTPSDHQYQLQIRSELFKLACFSSASRSQRHNITHFLEGFLQRYEPSLKLGDIPYDVPRDLLDPLTGDLLTEVELNQNQKSMRHQWVSGQDVLSSLNLESQSNTVIIRLSHGTTYISWNLPITAPTRTLYILANRVTEGKYSSFVLHVKISREVIRDSDSLLLMSTGLRTGSTLELRKAMPHSRKPHVIRVTARGSNVQQTISLPTDASALALISRVRGPFNSLLSDIRLWNGLTYIGDGSSRGVIVTLQANIRLFSSLDCLSWNWISTGSHKARLESRHLTRLQLMKELFNIFLNRISSFDTSVSLVLGLVTFADKALMKQELTPVFENFRAELDKVEAQGDTALYEALELARNSLVNFRRDLPGLRRRIVVVSDGKDTSIGGDPMQIGRALQKDRIVVDSVQVGKSFSNSLWAFSAATGGYRFFPRTSLADALSIFDLETMMNSAERPQRTRLMRAFSFASRELLTAPSLPLYPIDTVTIDQFPKRKEHPKLTEGVTDVRRATRNADTPGLKNDRTKRIMRELRDLIANPHPQIDVYVNDEDISFLKVVLEAPDDVENCPYKGGCFLLTCELPPDYPRNPPEIRFVTFILHPNVSKQGKVCVAELSRLWSSDITLKEIFSLVYGLLLEPDLDNPLEIQASLKYYDDDGTFALAAAKAVTSHASKSRIEWRDELDV